MKRIAILGSTGSIGCSALSVVEAHADRLKVVALAAGANAVMMARQVERFRPGAVAMATADSLAQVRSRLAAETVTGIDCFAHGPRGLVEIATQPDVDIVLCASSGTAALEAVVAAIRAGKTIALANKEVLVMAGALVTREARAHGVPILPVDSEHNAIHQCLHGRSSTEVARLILTASGGPFRDRALGRLADVSPEDALSHPTWKMGRKITIDSATLMNKGLEVIEAYWLFGVPTGRIEVLIHPQSVVHSLVELSDGSVIAQLGVTDMRLPIQYAFSWPERWQSPVPRLDLSTCGSLEFEAPDHARFPCLGLAYAALSAGGTQPVVLNAANEVAVASFLSRRVPFPAIPRLVEQALDRHARLSCGGGASLEAIREADAWARRFTRESVAGGLET
ncbi:MAG: 1-deoxy-D-xylulose-5-phosphate reductoisomerase [Luteitalea sp.]|nr:1-deoxy-D-xylulose-5-phosphate reductoisomerase [Luteitalea sp.]